MCVEPNDSSRLQPGEVPGYATVLRGPVFPFFLYYKRWYYKERLQRKDHDDDAPEALGDDLGVVVRARPHGPAREIPANYGGGSTRCGHSQ